MSALRGIRSQLEISKFRACGSELLSNTACFSVSKWESTFEALEAARCDTAVLPPLSSLSSSTACEALRHYHNVYERGAQLIVLHPKWWEKWREGIVFFLDGLPASADGAGSGGSDAIRDGGSRLRDLCNELLHRHGELFTIAFWGTTPSSSLRLKALLSQLRSGQLATSSVSSKQGDPSVSDEECCTTDEVSTDDLGKGSIRLQKLFFRELYSFQRIAYEAAHLFDFYAAVGRAEREWLADTVLLEMREEAAEVLIRRSFKRDVSVPSADLVNGELLNEYALFEVNKSKEQVVIKKAEETLKGKWCALACGAFTIERCQGVSEHDIDATECVGDKNDTAVTQRKLAAGNTFPSDIVRCISREGGRCLAAFGAGVREVLHAETLCTTGGGLRQLEVLLSLFLRWFEYYVRERHKGDIPLFVNEDLWELVLQRHTELLKLVVTTHFNTDSSEYYGCALEGVELVALSVIQCLNIYRASTSSTRAYRGTVDEEPAQSAKQLVMGWIQNTAIGVFLEGIESMCTQAAMTTTESNNILFATPLFTRIRVAVVKARLMFLCAGESSAMDIRQLLLPLLEPAFEEVSKLRLDAGGSQLADWVARLVSVLNSLRRTLYAPGISVGDGTEELRLSLHHYYQKLQRLSPAYFGDVIADGWSEVFYTFGANAESGISVFDLGRARLVPLANKETTQSDKEHHMNDVENTFKKLRTEK
uniref:Uncharacterized protein TCIL3000_11_15110 n=1 Tax=Trypanosoma congolense (strain IL3000) TaxID=1068625 RepID=G0V2X1_TRYCI|nr:unnamed protein product [Trypanosoma congolense IL3000]